MPGKEEEIVDVALSALAAAVRLQGISILKMLGTKLIGRDHLVVFQEEAPIRLVPEKFEDQSGRLGTMTVLCLDQKHGLTAIEKLNRAIGTWVETTGSAAGIRGSSEARP